MLQKLLHNLNNWYVFCKKQQKSNLELQNFCNIKIAFLFIYGSKNFSFFEGDFVLFFLEQFN